MANLLPELNKKKPVNLLAEINSPSFSDQVSAGQQNLASTLVNAAAVPISGAAGALTGAVVGAGNLLGLTDEEGTDAGAGVVDQIQQSMGGFADTLNSSPAAQQQMQSIGEGAQALNENIIQPINENVISPAIAGTAGLANVALNPISNIQEGFSPAQQTVEAVKEQGLFDAAGQQTLEETGSPLAATIVKTLPESAGAILSGTQLLKSITKPRKEREKIIAEQIVNGNPDIDNVRNMLDRKGNVVKNKTAINAIEQLGDTKEAKDMVTVFDVANRRTKNQIGEMVEIIRRGEKEPLYKQDNRPSNVIGKAVANRARDINTLNKNAGVKIGAIAKELKGTKVDIQQPIVTFIDELQDLGVGFQTGKDGWITPDFSRSKFKGGSQQEMSVLINELAGGNFNFQTAHKLKQEIRSNLNYDKTGKDKISGSGVDLLKNLSSKIDEVLDNKSERYNKANIKYAKTIGLVEKFDKMTGKEIDIFSDMSPESLQKVSRHLSSNNATRPALKQTLQETDDVLKEFNINYKDDLNTMVYAVNSLENMFNVVPSRTFDSGIARGTGMAIEASTTPSMAIARFSDKILSKKEPSFDEKIKALMKLLNN